MLIKDLDKNKLNHIYSISTTYQFKSQFLHIHGSPAYDNDLLEIYDEFCYLQQLQQKLSLKTNVDIIPGAKDTLKMLKDRNIKIGASASNIFNKEHMDLCINIVKRYGIQIDWSASTSCLNKVIGTNSDMIKLNMKQMGIDETKSYFKSR